MEIKLEHVLLFLLFFFLLKMIMDKCGCKGLIEGLGSGKCEIFNADCEATDKKCCGLNVRDCKLCRDGVSFTPPYNQGDIDRQMNRQPAATRPPPAGPAETTRPSGPTAPPGPTQAPTPATRQCDSLDQTFCSNQDSSQTGKIVRKTGGTNTYTADISNSNIFNRCCRRPKTCQEWKNWGASCSAEETFRSSSLGTSDNAQQAREKCCQPKPTQPPPPAVTEPPAVTAAPTPAAASGPRRKSCSAAPPGYTCPQTKPNRDNSGSITDSWSLKKFKNNCCSK